MIDFKYHGRIQEEQKREGKKKIKTTLGLDISDN